MGEDGNNNNNNKGMENKERWERRRQKKMGTFRVEAIILRLLLQQKGGNGVRVTSFISFFCLRFSFICPACLEALLSFSSSIIGGNN